MDHFRLRKYRGPEVWARVREAYVAGEPGPQLAQRFDVGLANLRKKAAREGWTRTHAARARDPLILATQPTVMGAPAPQAPSEGPVDPADAFEAALTGAAAAIAQGRGAEAQGLLKAAETLARLRQESPPQHLPTPEEWATQQAELEELWEREKAAWRAAETKRLEAWAAEEAMKRAEALLSEPGYVYATDFALSALHWRARHLGPDQALIDLQRGITGGWANRYWDPEGRLRPLTEPAMPSDQMLRQCLGPDPTWPPEWVSDFHTSPSAAPAVAAPTPPSSEPAQGPRARIP